MDVQLALRSLEGFDLKIAQFYAWLREAYAEDAEASLVFHRMHLEEKGHAYLVQYARRLVRQNPQLFRGVDLDFGEIHECLRGVTDAMHQGLAPDLPRAVRLGVEMEAAVAEMLFRKVIQHPRQEAFGLLGVLGSAGRPHRCVLCEFGRKRGYLPLSAGSPCPLTLAGSECRWTRRRNGGPAVHGPAFQSSGDAEGSSLDSGVMRGSGRNDWT